MAVQSSFYNGTALDSRTFPSTKHIATKRHMVVYRRVTETLVWELFGFDEYQLINNSAVLNDDFPTATHDKLEIRVSDTEDELAADPDDVSIVAGIADEIVVVSDNLDSIVNVSDNIEVISECGENIDACIKAMNGPAGEPSNIELFTSDGSGQIELSGTYNTVSVYSNGVLLTPADDYIFSSGFVTFTPILPTGSKIQAYGWISDPDFKLYDTFRSLNDTPNSFAGMQGKTVVVNDLATGLAFTDPSDIDLDDYVLKSGDTMVGDLELAVASGDIGIEINSLNASDSGYASIGFDTVGSYSFKLKMQPSSATYQSQFMLEHYINGVKQNNPIEVDNTGFVDMTNGAKISGYTPLNIDDIATVGFVNDAMSGGVDLTAYVKKEGYSQAGDEMTGPLVIANQTADEAGLIIKQFADNKSAINIHSENSTEYSSIGFFDETGGGAFVRTWGVSTLSNDEFFIGRYDSNGSHVDNPIHIGDTGVVTAIGLVSTNGSKQMDSGYVPAEDLSVATKKYVDDNISGKENVLIWEATPTTANIAISSLPVNPETDDRTGEYLFVFSDSNTDITTASGTPNVSSLYLFNEAQHAAGTTTGYTPGTGTQLSFCMATGGYFQAWKFESAGSDVRWYIHRIYRVQRVGS